VRFAGNNRLPIRAVSSGNDDDCRSRAVRGLLYDHHDQHDDDAQSVWLWLHLAGKQRWRLVAQVERLRRRVRLPTACVRCPGRLRNGPYALSRHDDYDIRADDDHEQYDHLDNNFNFDYDHHAETVLVCIVGRR
jgi:hypothetical protein